MRHINTMSGESWSPQRRVQTRGGPGQHRGGQLGGGHHRHDGPLAQPQRHQQHPRARRRHPRWAGRPGQGGRLENFKLLHLIFCFSIHNHDIIFLQNIAPGAMMVLVMRVMTICVLSTLITISACHNVFISPVLFKGTGTLVSCLL